MVRIHPDPPPMSAGHRDVGIRRTRRGHSSAGRAPALQAGGHRFDPGWLHQYLAVFQMEPTVKRNRGFLLAVSFIRLLFNNSEEVKRIRFSQTGFVWVVIAL